MWPRRIALAAAVLTGALLAAAVWLAVVASTATAFTYLAVGLVVAPSAAALGLLVMRRAPGAVVGLLLVFIGLTVSFTVAKEVAWQALIGRTELQHSVSWLIAILNESAVWAFVSFALLVLFFPDGQVPSRRWRWVPAVLVLCAALDQAQGAFEPIPTPLQHLGRPFGHIPFALDLAGFIAFLLLLVLTVACAVSLVLRFRRSDRIQRQQIKWLALAGFGVPLYAPLCLLEIAIWGRSEWFSVVIITVAAIAVPVAAGIAILHHDLYDVDRALAATVTWALITIMLIGIFAGSSLTAGLALGRGSPPAAAVAAVVCALALMPLRVRLQRLVDRRLYPLRRAALAAIDSLHRSMDSGAARPEELQQTLRAALRDPALRVAFQVPGTDRFIDIDGQRVDSVGGTAVILSGAQIGVIVPGGGDASPELLRQVADRCMTLVEVVRLRLELAHAVREVESSRTRLVQIGYEERRRLERDLHDGAQQRLVSLGMAIRLAQRHLTDGTIDVDGLLDQSVAELSTAVAELRQIAHGLRPSSLDDGLPAALAALVRNVPLVVEMDVCPDPLPDDVATTAYFVVTEAVANTVKHADASCITLQVARLDGHLMVNVADDGCGGATLYPKSALSDRVTALGGRLHVESPAGRGTIVKAALPCAS